MKNYYLFLASMLLICNVSVAQYQVSTEVQPKNALLEEFTGINCGNCPDAHKIVANLLLAQEHTVYAIAIHSGYYASPFPDQPDFRTEEGETLDATFVAGSGYPCGMINRHIFAGSIPIMSRSNWTLCAKEIHQEDAPVNLYVTATYSAADAQLSVHVEGYYTSDVDAEQNLLTVALTQNNIKGPQSGGGVGSDYVHQHMLRDYLTPLWGDTISDCTAGTYFTKDYTYTVPEYINDVAVEPAELEVIVFIANDKTDVLNVTGVKPTCEGLELPLAAEISAYRIPVQGTYGFNFYELYLRNKSNETLTSAQFDVTVNGTTMQCLWEGKIAPLATSYIKVPVDQASLIETSNDYSIQLTAVNGEAYDGNTIDGTFRGPAVSTPKTLIELRTDLYADENTWCIKDADGNIIYNYGPYETNLKEVYNEIAELEADKTYCFEVTDAWANGVQSPRGYFKLYDDSNGLVAQQLEITGHGYRSFFTTSATAGINKLAMSGDFAVSYNKSAREINITPASAGNDYAVAAYNLSGVLMAQGNNITAIPVTSKGAYIIRITTGNDDTQIFKIITN